MLGERIFPLVGVLVAQAAAGDVHVAAFVATVEGERATGTRAVAALVAQRFGLRDGLDVEAAADVLWALTAPDLADRLVVCRGWGWDRFELRVHLRVALPVPEGGAPEVDSPPHVLHVDHNRRHVEVTWAVTRLRHAGRLTVARTNRSPQPRRCAPSSSGVTTVNSAPAAPTASAAQSSESVLIRMRQPAPASSTLTHRPTRARTASTGASTSTSTS